MHVIESKSARIPLLGVGTWELRGRTCARIVEQALRLDYRHIDTAEIYENEREVGEGIRASGMHRDDVFVVSKVWPSHFAPRSLERAAKNSLARLRLSHVDLLLLHWPNPQVPLSETLGALCAIKQAGLARHIGVSNFTLALIEQSVQLSSEPLVCNQIEMNPFVDRWDLIAGCRRHGVAIVAHSPLARGRISNDSVLGRIGRKHGRSAAQVALRWLVQQGIPVIPRTTRVERLVENGAIFDFEITDAEMAEVASLVHRDEREKDDT
jgi:2,5-diketo-D-gluconate reductase B